MTDGRRTVELIDTTVRDGNQSLWGATGLTTPDVLAIAPVVDRVGYHAIDYTTSTHLAVSVRYHREDPWERLRLAHAAMPRTPLTFLTTGTRFISWRPAADDLLDLAFRTVVRNGVRRFQIMHPSNDGASIARMAALARRAGAAEIVLALTYSLSPAHDDGYWSGRIAELAACPDADRVYLKDPGGLLVPDRARHLIEQLRDAFGERPVEIHSHCTTSLAPLVYVDAVRAGAAAVHTAVRPLALGTGQPSAEMTASNLAELGVAHDLDMEALRATSAYFADLAREKGLPTASMPEYDHAYYRHQLPGGMVGTMRRQLEEMRRPELFDAALDEVARVRAELGYPIMVTPLSQFVVTQAVMNVLAGARYENVPDEVVRYLLGQFGVPAAPPDPQVADRVLSGARAEELGRVEPLSTEGARERFGKRISDEELLLRLTMPEEQVDAMLAEHRPAAGREAVARPGRSPVVRLLRELDRRPSIEYLHLRTDDEVVEWRRAERADAAS
jgi:oxaloacetate decarboxylase (Na+ extruding) subunit alpha